MFKITKRLRYNYKATDTLRMENTDTGVEESVPVLEVMQMIDNNQLEGWKYHISVPYRGYQTIRFEKII